MSCLASQHTRAGRVPTSPDKHAKTATIPFRAWVFLPREGMEPKLWSRRSTGQGILLQESIVSSQHPTLQRQPRSDFPAAGPGLLSFPPGEPPPFTVFALLGTTNYNCSCWERGGSSAATCTAGQAGALGSWGKGCVVWQGQRFLQPLLLPQNAAGRKME